MRQWIRSHLTFANVVSLAALFVALGGTATAVTYVVSSNSQVGPGTISGHRPPSGKHANIIAGSISGLDVANDSLGGADINEGKLFKVPRAARADSAASADNATRASTADTATNAQTLAGHQASDFFLHCPGNLARAGDLCFDVERSAPYAAALKACARDQLRLPDAGELALVFDHLGAVQSQHWTASHFIENIFEVATLAQNSSRDLLTGASGINQPEDFRCVTSATN